MTAARKVLAGVGIALVAIVLLAAAFLWWVLATPSGARWGFARIASAMKGSVRVVSLEGPLRGPFTLHGITYETPSMTVTIDRARVEWRLSELLAKRLDILSLRANGVRIRTAPAAEAKKREALPDFHLPINVIVRDAVVSDIETVSDGGAPFRIDSVTLATSVSGDTVRIRRLAVRGPTFTADASGTLQPQGAYPLDLATQWTWSAVRRTPDGKRETAHYAGEGRLSGTLEKLRVVQRLSEPAGVAVDATLFTPMRDLRFSGDHTVRKFDPRRLASQAPAATVTGNIHAEGSLESFTIHGEAAIRTDVAGVGSVRTSFSVKRDRDLYRIDRLQLVLPEGSTASASGTVRLSGKSPVFDLTASWSRLEWPLRGPAAVVSSQGEVHAAGTLDAYALSAKAQVRAKEMPPGSWTLAAHGDSSRLALESLHGEVLGGTSWPTARWVGSLGSRGTWLSPARTSIRPDSPRIIRGDWRSRVRRAARSRMGGPKEASRSRGSTEPSVSNRSPVPRKLGSRAQQSTSAEPTSGSRPRASGARATSETRGTSRGASRRRTWRPFGPTPRALSTRKEH